MLFIGKMNRYRLHIISIFLLITLQVFANKTSKPGFFYKNLIYSLEYHPVHISFTNVEYNEEKGTFLILYKFFVDDFNLILKNKYGKDLQLMSGKWDRASNEIVDKYILEHFKLIINNKDKTKSSLKFIRKEIKENAMWLYYDFNSKEKSNNFVVYNTFFNDLYLDQSNLLIFTYKGEQKAYKFDQSNIKEIFSF
jgi:hypothetical protein